MSCRCLLCVMERQLAAKFATPGGRDAYRQFATFSPALSTFEAAADLISSLHSEPSTANGNPSKDEILAELFCRAKGNGSSVISRELLLWAFVPMLHRISRQVVLRSPGLMPDDVSQHIVTALLESFSSPEFVGRSSHLAFAVARLLRRNTFAWAEKEMRGAVAGPGIETLESAIHSAGPQLIERAALLCHFLDRCRRQGVLSGEELELLVQFKLDELPSADYSNAARQRMKRLLAKLRRAAQHPRRSKVHATQLSLF